mmetsp:Transcript_92674/g.262191  ORF Transcript_92674/g.262191 Transcript_92674/m.262191 type:complete len:240 (+) Transcript_92674:196-915(+)
MIREASFLDERHDPLPFEVLAQDLKYVLHGDVPSVGDVKPLEGIVQQIVGQLDARVQHCRQEVGVVDFLVTVVVCDQCIPYLPEFRVVHLILRQLLPQLVEGDAALVLGVHLEKDGLHGRALLLTERPRSDLHAAAAEHRAVAEVAQGFDCHRVHLVDALGVPLRDPGVLQGALRCQSLFRVHGEQRGNKTHRIFRNVLPLLMDHLEVSFHDLFGLAEGHVAREESEDDHTEAPLVTLA